MRVLVTGGGGLVGRNVSEVLSNAHSVLAPSRQELDLFDSTAVESFFRDAAPDIVIHCAGVVGGIQANIREPVRFLVDNIELGKNVVLAARTVGVRRLLNLGSSCMYPRGAPNPLREEYILNGKLEPTNEGYAIAKIAIQRLCAYISREEPGLQYKTIVPCNLYGKWDKFDPEYSHLIPALIRKMHDAKTREASSVSIWGSGKARREFLYAGDLADLISNALTRFSDLPEIMNVGLGYDYSIDEYYESVAAVVGYKGTFYHDESKPEGMPQKLVDISALRTFGWKANTTLAEGLSMTYDFYKGERG